MPMYPDFETAIEETLNSIDCPNRTIGSEDAQVEDWAVIRESWANTAIALVTAARYRTDRAAFENWLKALEQFQDEDPDLHHRIHHEQCLWAIWDMDFKLLDALLADWKTENCDPVWIMRKSALLWEAGRDSEAEDLLKGAIASIRAMPKDRAKRGGTITRIMGNFSSVRLGQSTRVFPAPQRTGFLCVAMFSVKDKQP